MSNVINFEHSRELLSRAAFDLKLWLSGANSGFISILFDLIARADASNKNKLRSVYPYQVSIYEEWQRSSSEKAFFEKWGLR